MSTKISLFDFNNLLTSKINTILVAAPAINIKNPLHEAATGLSLKIGYVNCPQINILDFKSTLENISKLKYDILYLDSLDLMMEPWKPLFINSVKIEMENIFTITRVRSSLENMTSYFPQTEEIVF